MDVNGYRAAETLGRQAVRSIRHSAVHAPVLFDNPLFPIRISNHEDLAAYLDIMHEGRYPRYIEEMGGLCEHEVAQFVDGLVEYCRFFSANFSQATAPLPLSGMLSQYCLARKLNAIPERARILEIGPGSGLVAFFLAADPQIRTYDQIETSEAFYLLQNLIGRYLYRDGYLDHAPLDATTLGCGDVGVSEALKVRQDILESYEQTYTVPLNRKPRSEHFPWWKIAAVFERQYDVVTSNANLTEFTPSALKFYTALIQRVLKPSGVFLAQCIGGGLNDKKATIKAFIDVGFVPLVMAGGYPIPGAEPGIRRLAAMNVVMLPRDHPSIREISFPADGGGLINPQEPLTRAIFGMDRRPDRRPSQDEIVALVTGRL